MTLILDITVIAKIITALSSCKDVTLMAIKDLVLLTAAKGTVELIGKNYVLGIRPFSCC